MTKPVEFDVKIELELDVKLFRDAFEAALKSIRHPPTGIGNFPSGACEVSSVMLMTFLASRGYEGVTYVSGTRHNGNQSHSFLKYENQHVDITGSQFEDCNDEIIIQPDHPLHASFKPECRGHTDIFKYSAQGKINFSPFYNEIIMRINQTPSVTSEV